MAYLGNLTCGDCGLTFTARWGSLDGAFEYRCEQDHVVHVHPDTGSILAVDGDYVQAPTLIEMRGLCPLCRTELSSGVLPACPVCGSREHDVAISGSLG